MKSNNERLWGPTNFEVRTFPYAEYEFDRYPTIHAWRRPLPGNDWPSVHAQQAVSPGIMEELQSDAAMVATFLQNAAADLDRALDEAIEVGYVPPRK